jgi:hypothetical protein
MSMHESTFLTLMIFIPVSKEIKLSKFLSGIHILLSMLIQI